MVLGDTPKNYKKVGIIMEEPSRNEVILFNILEELYELNNRQWKQRIFLVLLDQEDASYRRIKERFLEVPDMLVYRCIKELILEGMILKENEHGLSHYRFTDEGRALAPILTEVQ